MTSIRVLITALFLATTIVPSTYAAAEKTDNDHDKLFQERTYLGRPLTFWLKVLRDRDEKWLSDAFDAIHSLGNDAWVAVPELTKIVGAPFEPIAIGIDPMDVIAQKLYDISIRSEA